MFRLGLRIRKVRQRWLGAFKLPILDRLCMLHTPRFCSQHLSPPTRRHTLLQAPFPLSSTTERSPSHGKVAPSSPLLEQRSLAPSATAVARPRKPTLHTLLRRGSSPSATLCASSSCNRPISARDWSGFSSDARPEQSSLATAVAKQRKPTLHTPFAGPYLLSHSLRLPNSQQSTLEPR